MHQVTIVTILAAVATVSCCTRPPSTPTQAIRLPQHPVACDNVVKATAVPAVNAPPPDPPPALSWNEVTPDGIMWQTATQRAAGLSLLEAHTRAVGATREAAGANCLDIDKTWKEGVKCRQLRFPLGFLGEMKVEFYATQYRKDGRIGTSVVKLVSKGEPSYRDSLYRTLFSRLGVPASERFYYRNPGRRNEFWSAAEICKPPAKDGTQTCRRVPNAPIGMVSFAWGYDTGLIAFDQYSDYELLVFNYSYHDNCPKDAAACEVTD